MSIIEHSSRQIHSRKVVSLSASMDQNSFIKWYVLLTDTLPTAPKKMLNSDQIMAAGGQGSDWGEKSEIFTLGIKTWSEIESVPYAKGFSIFSSHS